MVKRKAHSQAASILECHLGQSAATLPEQVRPAPQTHSILVGAPLPGATALANHSSGETGPTVLVGSCVNPMAAPAGELRACVGSGSGEDVLLVEVVDQEAADVLDVVGHGLSRTVGVAVADGGQHRGVVVHRCLGPPLDDPEIA